LDIEYDEFFPGPETSVLRPEFRLKVNRH
jgi:hypothetical protein